MWNLKWSEQRWRLSKLTQTWVILKTGLGLNDVEQRLRLNFQSFLVNTLNNFTVALLLARQHVLQWHHFLVCHEAYLIWIYNLFYHTWCIARHDNSHLIYTAGTIKHSDAIKVKVLFHCHTHINHVFCRKMWSSTEIIRLWFVHKLSKYRSVQMLVVSIISMKSQLGVRSTV